MDQQQYNSIQSVQAKQRSRLDQAVNDAPLYRTFLYYIFKSVSFSGHQIVYEKPLYSLRCFTGKQIDLGVLWLGHLLKPLRWTMALPLCTLFLLAGTHYTLL